MQENATEAAGRQDGFFCQDRENFSGGLIEHVCANTGQGPVNVGWFNGMMRRRQQIHCRRIRDHIHARMRLHTFEKRAFDGESRLVLVVDDSGYGMAGLGREIKFFRVIWRIVERHAKLVDQDLLHQTRTFAAQQDCGFGRAKPGSRGKNVRNKLLGLFFVAAIDDSALCAVRVAVFGVRSAG